LAVSLHQLALVLLFNEVQRLSVKEMAAQTGLSISDVHRSVKALIELGLFKASEKQVGEDTELAINPEFTRWVVKQERNE
jgi:predicted transcriptional regulator